MANKKKQAEQNAFKRLMKHRVTWVEVVLFLLAVAAVRFFVDQYVLYTLSK